MWSQDVIMIISIIIIMSNSSAQKTYLCVYYAYNYFHFFFFIVILCAFLRKSQTSHGRVKKSTARGTMGGGARSVEKDRGRRRCKKKAYLRATDAIFRMLIFFLLTRTVGDSSGDEYRFFSPPPFRRVRLYFYALLPLLLLSLYYSRRRLPTHYRLNISLSLSLSPSLYVRLSWVEEGNGRY